MSVECHKVYTRKSGRQGIENIRGENKKRAEIEKCNNHRRVILNMHYNKLEHIGERRMNQEDIESIY